MVTIMVIRLQSYAPSCTDQFGRDETAFNNLTIRRITVGSHLHCESVARITGLYVYCPMTQDVTLSAV
jgi:hypothetical protein